MSALALQRIRENIAAHSDPSRNEDATTLDPESVRDGMTEVPERSKMCFIFVKTSFP